MSSRPQRRPAPAPLPAPVVTIALIALNVIAFAIEVALGADPMSPTPGKLLALGANQAPFTLGGEPWRLVTAMFLHAGLIHLVVNMYGLWATGQLVERMYGRAGFVALYLLAGLGGGLATVLRHTMTPSVGASGAIFGVFAALGAWLLIHRDRIDRKALRLATSNLLVVLAINVYLGLRIPSIDMAAHVGGLVVGFAVAIALEWRRVPPARSMTRLAAVTAVGLAAIAAAVFALRQPSSGADLARAVNDFSDMEHRTGAIFNDLIRKSKAHEINDADIARHMEADVLPPWRAMHERLAALAEPPAKLKELHDSLGAYVDARLAYWNAVDRLAHGEELTGPPLSELERQANLALMRLQHALDQRR
ncbi:MAG TPA: rhomboid family intramembrane serine protease [Kofleriaceae bacterium]|nr:rhomboid family intramembrane serine protease [Kofleriaceae bacterium]